MSTPLAYYPHSNYRHDYSYINTVPECTCFAILIERKFIASRGPPPLLDAERVAQSIHFSKEAKRKLRFYVYHDRLLVLDARHRNDKLADIFYDDIVQLERLKGDILFILCGRRGIGVYYFFKLSDGSKIDCIIQLARKINPNFRFFEANDIWSVQNYQRPGNDDISEYDSCQFKLDSTTSSSTYSGSNAGILLCNDSFVEWKGQRSTRKNNPENPSRGHPIKRLPIRSRSHSPRRKNEKRRRSRPSKKGRRAMMPLENYPLVLKSFDRPALVSAHKSRPYSIATDRHTRRSSNRPKPRTFILKTNIKSDHGRNTAKQPLYSSLDISDSSESTNDLPTGRYQNTNGSRNRDARRYNLNDYGSFEQAQSMGFNGPFTRMGQLRSEKFSSDAMSSTTEDSLYLERELQNRMPQPRSPSDYLPELKHKFRQLNLK